MDLELKDKIVLVTGGAKGILSARTGHITAQHIFVNGGYAHLDRSLT